jgi:secondary thiamine-phosphate synthase enzyme
VFRTPASLPRKSEPAAVFHQLELQIATQGRGTYSLTQQVQDCVSTSGIEVGICHLFIQHTSASLMLCENADPAVMLDLETFMQRLAPDGDPMFTHTAEGPDDMPAHIRSILTQSDLNLPIADGRCAVGVWQGIYLWEHRIAPHRRKVTVTLNGE